LGSKGRHQKPAIGSIKPKGDRVSSSKRGMPCAREVLAGPRRLDMAGSCDPAGVVLTPGAGKRQPSPSLRAFQRSEGQPFFHPLEMEAGIDLTPSIPCFWRPRRRKGRQGYGLCAGFGLPQRQAGYAGFGACSIRHVGKPSQRPAGDAEP